MVRILNYIYASLALQPGKWRVLTQMTYNCLFKFTADDKRIYKFAVRFNKGGSHRILGRLKS